MLNYKKRKLTFGLIILVVNILLICICNSIYRQNIGYGFNITSNASNKIQIFQADSLDNFKEENSIYYDGINNELPIYIKKNMGTNTQYIRIDFEETQNSVNKISDLIISKGKNQQNIMDLIDDTMVLHSCTLNSEVNNFTITTNGEDPYIIVTIDKVLIDSVLAGNTKPFIVMALIACIIGDMLILFVYHISKKSRFIKDLFKNRKLIWDLAKNDMKTKYAGSFFGVIWAFVQPVVTVLLYWFVFQVGLRSGDVGDVPFVLWLMCGLVPWFFFQDGINAITNCMIEYSYLVKKMVFQIDILPIVKMLSSLFIHIFFIAFMLLIFCLMGYVPTITAVQILYYVFCTIVLVLGIGYTTSVLVIFFKDLGQIIQIVLQIGMWMTPILWNIHMLPNQFLWLMKLNPMYYIVNGFREALIDKVWFWNQIDSTINFWLITIFIYALGMHIFKKLRPHLADVL